MRNIFPLVNGMQLLKTAQTIIDLQEDLSSHGIRLSFDKACKVYEVALLEKKLSMSSDYKF